MGHVVLTTAVGRVEINLDAEQEGVVARFLLAMIAVGDVASAPAGRDGHSVLAPAAASGGDDSPGAGEPPAPRLPARTCERDGCDVVFQPNHSRHVYCGEACGKAAHIAGHREKVMEARSGDHACIDCPRTFTSEHALGVHRGRTHKGRGPSTEPDATRQPHQRRSEPLPERTCALERCGETFVPKRVDQRFHTRECMKAQLHLDSKPAVAAHRCDEPGCGKTFPTGQALGGHKATHRTKGKAQPARSTARQNGAAPAPDRRGEGRFECSCGRRFTTGEARGLHQDEDDCGYVCPCGESFASAQAHALHQTRKHLKLPKSARSTARPTQTLAKPLAKLPHSGNSTTAPPALEPRNQLLVTRNADRPFACKEPGCGHPCRSRGELEKHREAYHDSKRPLPVTTQVLAAMSFPCPEDGCGRVYDDENRLTHHWRVTHDPERIEPIHEVVVSTAAKAVKVG